MTVVVAKRFVLPTLALPHTPCAQSSGGTMVGVTYLSILILGYIYLL